ncbi:MAG: hypothetical protein JW759_08935 [Candidatus Coatesbacteria bacterium]|nr:hypothetical protein [Candidatus Coatesbacteria bacterium]
MRFALVTVSFATLHVFGVYHGRIDPHLMFLLTLVLSVSASLAFVVGLVSPSALVCKMAEPKVVLLSRIAAVLFVIAAIGAFPGCPFLLWGVSLPTRLCFLAVFAAACWVAFKRTWVFAALLALVSLLCRLPIFFAGPLDPKTSDMLPLITLACKRFLSGANPYFHYLMPWKLPLTYLPATWLAFLPGHVLGIDPRWSAVLFSCAAVLVVLDAFPISHTDPMAGPKRLLFAALMLSSIDLQFSAITPESFFWLALSLFILFLARDKHIEAALAMGVCLAARQQAILLLPFYLIYVFKQLSGDSRWRCLVLTFAIPILLCLPFLISSPAGFVSGVYTHFDPFALEKWINERAWENSLSFAPFSFEHQLHCGLKPIIAALQLALYLLALRRLRGLSDLICFLGLSLLAFLLFSPIIWPYMFTPLLILLFGSFIAPGDLAESERS